MTATLEVCGLDDAEELMSFVREHWSERHVLATSRALLDWQHRDEAARRYTFVLAREANSIVGMLGYIAASRYDPALRGTSDTLWLTTWKVRSDRATGLGLALLRKLSAIYPAGWIGTVGLNPATRPIYEALGYRTGKLDRHYLLNPRLDFKLARVPQGFLRATSRPGRATLTPLPAGDLLRPGEGIGIDDGDQIPRKTRVFLYNRYLTHPFYRYDAYLLADGKRKGIVVIRACSHDGARALRVVDYLGSPEPLAAAGPAFVSLLGDVEAEYLDFYCSGLGQELSAAGFRTVGVGDELVLPGYFEPFVVSNVDLLYAIKGPPGRLVIGKGDADQDRPSQLGR